MSFPKFGKFSNIISSNELSGPFFSSSSFRIPIMCILVLLMFNYFPKAFFTFFILFSSLADFFPMACLKVCWSFLLLDLVYYWTPLVTFSIQLCSSPSWFLFWYFLILSITLLQFFLFMHYSLDLSEYLYDSYSELSLR